VQGGKTILSFVACCKGIDGGLLLFLRGAGVVMLCHILVGRLCHSFWTSSYVFKATPM